MRQFQIFSVVLAGVLALAAPASAEVRIFSYDPANDLTRKVAGDLTFEFNQRLIFTTILRIQSTEGEASAGLKPADEKVLGHGGLNRLIGSHAQERDLYAVKAEGQGSRPDPRLLPRLDPRLAGLQPPLGDAAAAACR